MDERILYWLNNGLDSAISNTININGVDTFYVIDRMMANKAYLQPYYTAFFYVDGKYFIVPGTEELKMFSLTECKVICGLHWAKYYDNAYFPKTIIQPPPPEILSPNQ